MAAIDLVRRNVPPTDNMDDSLFDYDVGDAFRDVDINMDVPAVQQPTTTTGGKDDGGSLGIDEEIKVTRKRASVPKLDETRLLSPAGIPKLRRLVKERLKFKGKGREVWRSKAVKRYTLTSYDPQYSDVARLLNAYQLWLDDLYPRAKFADGLAIIEKLGHTKRMQTMRREWIQEGKPREILGNLRECAEKPAGQQKSEQKYGWEVEPTERPQTPLALLRGDDDLHAATPKSGRDDGTRDGNSDKENSFLGESTDFPLVSERDRDSAVREQNFEDDEDALLALNDAW